MTPPDKADWTREWVAYAESELAAAHSLLETEGLETRHACWHIQQSLEKAIKAALIADGIQPELTHDLTKLLDALPSKWNGGLKKTIDAKRVSSWATGSRYPNELPQVSRADAQAMFNRAKMFVQEITKGINMRLDNTGPSLM